MKKILTASICLLLLFCLTTPAFAADLTVPFTSDSLPEVGGTLTVDKEALLNNGSITSEMYNALLEGNVIYSWYRNDILVQAGTGGDSYSYKLTSADQGCTVYVEISFFEDSSFQESKKCGEAVSAKTVITGPTPEILTQALPNAVVGTAYYVRLECSDPDAVFSEFMGSQLTEFGLNLTQHGEIEGTPTKAGNCHINVVVVSEGGGENSVSFDLTVADAAPEPSQEPTAPASEPTPPASEPTPPASEPTQPPASDPVDATDGTQAPTDANTQDDEGGDQGFPWWGYALIALGGIGVGIGIAFIFDKLKKKA